MNLPRRMANVLTSAFILLGTVSSLVESASSTPNPAIYEYLCPSGLDLVSAGQCRGFAQTYKDLCREAITTAVGICNSLKALPIIVRNDEEQEYWRNLNYNQKLIGITCNTNTNKWIWADGTDINFRPSQGYDSELDGPCLPNATWYFYNDGKWQYDYDLGSYWTSLDINCIADLKKPELREDDCIQFDHDASDSACYKVSESPEYWSDAQDKCKSVGANLASIHSSQANKFVHDLAVSKGLVNGLHLGATVTGKANEFGWIDGSQWNYTNFLPGFPINGFGDCITMATGDLNGEWANGGCTVKLPSVCSRKPYTDSPTNVCHGADIKEGDLVRTPGFPTDASTYCDFTLRVDQGKQVEIEVLLLEANNCCDHFVLYEVTAAGDKQIANLTGAISGTKYRTTSSNLMRASWQPNGGVNVRGAMFTFRGL